MIFDDVGIGMDLSKWAGLGTPAVLGGLAFWFTKWLPKHLESRDLQEATEREAQQKRYDKLIDTFQIQMAAERTNCQAQFNLVISITGQRHSELLAALKLEKDGS